MGNGTRLDPAKYERHCKMSFTDRCAFKAQHVFTYFNAYINAHISTLYYHEFAGGLVGVN